MVKLLDVMMGIKKISDSLNRQNENLQKVIYNLIYPAMLGSMMYDLFSINWGIFLSYYMKVIWTEPRYIVSIGLVLFYLFDYYNLYTVMRIEYGGKIRAKTKYLIVDFLVSLLLVVAFKSYKYKPGLSILLIALVPVCFLVYSIMLKTDKDLDKGKTLSVRFEIIFLGMFIAGILIGNEIGKGLIYIAIWMGVMGYGSEEGMWIAKLPELVTSYFFLAMVFLHGREVLRRKKTIWQKRSEKTKKWHSRKRKRRENFKKSAKNPDCAKNF